MAAAAFGCAALLAACVGVPVQEMSDARMAVSAAEAVQAGELSPRTMATSKRLLEEADAALRSGANETARQRAGAARVNAIEARRTAVLIGNASNAMQTAGSHPEAETLLAAARAAALEGDDARAQSLALRARELLL